MPQDRIYPAGVQTFSDVIEQGMVYVDKTALVYRMVKKYKYAFLSRPRRFGKSLLSSTLCAYFTGQKHLFEGLAIENLEKDWVAYPVIHFDMSVLKNCDVNQLPQKFNNLLKDYEADLGIDNAAETPGDRLSELIKHYFKRTGKKVVIIIDEYDAPLLDVLHEDAQLSVVRTMMQEFYAPIKSCDAYIRMAFITGITKFSQLSIFSTINNVTNISMEPEFAAICGITKHELSTVLKEDVDILAKKNHVPTEAMLEQLTDNYDGYHFSRESEDIFNPYSLMRCFAAGYVDNYWYASGTSTYLIHQLRRFHTDVTSLDDIFAFASSFDRPTDDMTDALPLLYQSGYLTIKHFDSTTRGYYLGIPNKEVRAGLMENLLPLYTSKTDSQSLGFAALFYQSLLKGDIDKAMEQMKAYFASIPYPDGGKEVLADMQKSEYYYETVLYIVLSLMNVAVSTQVKSCRGRADAVMFSPQAIFLFEIKINKLASAALKQIDEQGYMVPYSADGRKLYKIGISFSTATRTIEGWEYAIE